MRILNVVVFYENRAEVENYIREIYRIGNGAVKVAVVINSDSQEESSTMREALLKEDVDCFFLVDFGYNVGYLNALLLTIQKIDIESFDYFILSNTDIQYPKDCFFSKLMVNRYPDDVGCIAPSVYSVNSDSYSNPHYVERIHREKLERLIRIFSHPFLGKAYLKLAGLKASKEKAAKQKSRYVYSPHGCYMIFNRAFIRDICGYEYGTILYSEESCIGELLIKNNKKCFFDDSIEVIHNESSVTGKIDYKKRFSQWRESIEVILEEFY